MSTVMAEEKGVDVTALLAVVALSAASPAANTVGTHLAPKPPLLHKGRFGKDSAKAAQGNRVFALDRGRKEEDVFLDVWGQEQQVHDLRHSSTGDVRAAGDFGEIADLAGVHQFLNVMGQGERAGYLGH